MFFFKSVIVKINKKSLKGQCNCLLDFYHQMVRWVVTKIGRLRKPEVIILYFFYIYPFVICFSVVTTPFNYPKPYHMK